MWMRVAESCRRTHLIRPSISARWTSCMLQIVAAVWPFVCNNRSGSQVTDCAIQQRKATARPLEGSTNHNQHAASVFAVAPQRTKAALQLVVHAMYHHPPRFSMCLENSLNAINICTLRLTQLWSTTVEAFVCQLIQQGGRGLYQRFDPAPKLRIIERFGGFQHNRLNTCGVPTLSSAVCSVHFQCC